MDGLVDFGLPALVFVALAFWLVRKAARAARTEDDLEGERLEGALAEELRLARARAQRAQGQPSAQEAVPQPLEEPGAPRPRELHAVRGRAPLDVVQAAEPAPPEWLVPPDAPAPHAPAAIPRKLSPPQLDAELSQLVHSAVDLLGAMAPLEGADTHAASAAHLKLVEQLASERERILRAAEKGVREVPRRIEVLWVRSTQTHAVWCERRHPATRATAAWARDVICVAKIEDGRVVERWSF